jgi:hypothetical protein
MGLLNLTWQFSVGLFLSASLAQAQPTPGAVTIAPGTNTSVASPFQYHSIFTQYQQFIEQQVLPWKDSNDTVGKIGGWRFYAREASQPDEVEKATLPKPAPQTKTPDGPPIDVSPHSGHGGKP